MIFTSNIFKDFDEYSTKYIDYKWMSYSDDFNQIFCLLEIIILGENKFHPTIYQMTE